MRPNNICNWSMKKIAALLVGITLIAPLAADGLPQRSAQSNSTQGLKPAGCETNAALLDNVKAEFSKEAAGSIIIAVARLGRRDVSRELNRRRLFNVKYYLKNRLGLDGEKIVTAEAEQIEGYGRVEIYVGGHLLETLVAEPGKDLCVTCCGANEEFYPERTKRDKKHRASP